MLTHLRTLSPRNPQMSRQLAERNDMLTAELEAYEAEVGNARVALSRMAAMEDKLAAYEDQIRRFSEVLSGKDAAARDLEAEIDNLNKVIEELQVHSKKMFVCLFVCLLMI